MCDRKRRKTSKNRLIVNESIQMAAPEEARVKLYNGIAIFTVSCVGIYFFLICVWFVTPAFMTHNNFSHSHLIFFFFVGGQQFFASFSSTVNCLMENTLREKNLSTMSFWLLIIIFLHRHTLALKLLI